VTLFLAAALLSLLATEYLRLSLRELRTLIVEPVLFFFLLRATVRTPVDAGHLVDVLTVVATAVAALAIAQFFVGGAVTEVQGVRRVHGTYTSPNHLALLLAAGVLAAGIGLTVAPVERLAGRLDPTRGTALVRVQLWQAALELIREQPLLGIGLDNFLYRYAERLPPTIGIEPNLSHPHNLVLQFWLQLGLLGVVALGWLLVSVVRALWPHVGKTTPPVGRVLAVGALGSLVNFLAHGSVDNSYFLVDMAFIFWLTAAVAGVLPSRQSTPDPHLPADVQSRSAAPT
ncbi:MAG: O-antigen ligase family protein, partial [Chloroflexota bacterium]|nr:O-antigen ligase family protein [Chloroflexota bacterium]